MKTAKKLSAREAERILLYYMVERAAVREVVREKLASIQFEPLNQALRERIEALAQAKPTLGWTDLVEAFADQPDAQKLISEISFANYEVWGEEPEKVLDDCVLTLEIAYWQAAKVLCQHKLKEPLPRDEQDSWTRRYQEILKHLDNLDRQWRKMTQKARVGSEET